MTEPIARVRQDRLRWVGAVPKDPTKARVRWTDRDGTRHTRARREVVVWAPVSNRTLWAKLEETFTLLAPKAIAQALRDWRGEVAKQIVLNGLFSLEKEIIELRKEDWGQAFATPHGFVWNKKGPYPDTFRDRGFGGIDGEAWSEQAIEMIPEWLETAHYEVAYFIVAVEQSDYNAIPQLVLDHLPEQYRATCRGCGKPMPLTRSNVKYHDNACKQAAYRRRHAR